MKIFSLKGETCLLKRDRAAEQSMMSIEPAQFGSAAGEMHDREIPGKGASNVGEFLLSFLVVDGWIAFSGYINAG